MVYGHTSSFRLQYLATKLVTDASQCVFGGASVCDSNGNLLFYTNGRVVLDRNHAIMPGSIRLDAAHHWYNGAPNIRFEDSVITFYRNKISILQPSKQQQRYLLFYSRGYYKNNIYMSNNPDSSFLSYSVIDIQANGGLGAIASGMKSINIDSNFVWGTTPHTVISGYCGSWLVYAKLDNLTVAGFEQNFVIKHISEDGVVRDHSTIQMPFIRPRGQIEPVFFKPSPNGKLIAESAPIQSTIRSYVYTPSPEFIKLPAERYYVYDFDPVVGKITNARYRGTSWIVHFSPQGSKLLSFNQQKDSIWNPIILQKFDTTYLGDTLAIPQQTQGIDISHFSEFDMPGVDCRTIQLSTTMRNHDTGKVYIELSIIYYVNGDRNNENTLTTRTFLLEVSNADAAQWSVGDVKVLQELNRDNILGAYNNSGAEIVLRGVVSLAPNRILERNLNKFYRPQLNENAVVHSPNQWVDTAAVVPLCNGSVYLKAPYPDLPFVWWNGSTEDSIAVTQPGSYRVTTTLPHCSFSQDIVVVAPSVQLPPDTTICMQTPLQVRGVLNLAENPVWNTGEQTLSKTINEAGTYILRAESTCGSVADTITIKVRDCTCNPFVPNAFTPNNDGVNDVFKPMMQCTYSQFSFEVFNRFGNKVFQSRSADDGWDGLHLGKPADFGVYFWQLEFKNELGETMHFKGDVTLMR